MENSVLETLFGIFEFSRKSSVISNVQNSKQKPITFRLCSFVSDSQAYRVRFMNNFLELHAERNEYFYLDKCREKAFAIALDGIFDKHV